MRSSRRFSVYVDRLGQKEFLAYERRLADSSAYAWTVDPSHALRMTQKRAERLIKRYGLEARLCEITDAGHHYHVNFHF